MAPTTPRSTPHDEPSWLEELWMEVQAEIDAEELAERMDEDTNVEDSYAR